MKTLTINKGAVSATIEYDETAGTYTLKAGSIVGKISPSLSETTKMVREGSSFLNAKGLYEVKMDLPYRSLSALASFMTGSQTNGRKYFQNTILNPSAPTATTTPAAAPSVATKTEETTQPKENQEEPINVIAPEEKAKTITAPTAETKSQKQQFTKEEVKLRNGTAKKLDDFGGDFGFYIDNRIKDSLVYLSPSERNDFLYNAAELTGIDETLLEVAADKMKSAEWLQINEDLNKIKMHLAHERINKRLVIYYGEAGSGKTYQAQKEYGTEAFEVADATMKPSELFTTYDPTQNKYVKTLLSRRMEEGKPYILDEGNLASPRIWERLQGVLDNTSVIMDRGITINIKEGFKLITTMNLTTNLGKKPLPTPLVSRAEIIKKFEPVEDRRAENIW